MVAEVAVAPRRGLRLVVQAWPMLLLDTLVDALEAVGHDVGGATTDASAVPELVAELVPDVCVVQDAERASCLEAAGVIRRRSPGVKVVVLSDGASPQTRRALETGVVDAVVIEACDFAALGSVVGRVARGERYVAMGARPPVATLAPRLVLTPRERQVLQHLVRGATTQAIAQDLQISTHTVRSHVQGLTKKLGTHGRARAVRTALTHDLLGSA